MIIDVIMPHETLDALQRARRQLSVREVQLASCRICGAEHEETRRAILALRALEATIEEAIHVYALEPQS
jgi:hypothetical protein